MPKYSTVATGGTFDHIHAGHKRLLQKSFESGDRVIIGLTSDDFVTKLGKKPDYDYEKRESELRKYLEKTYSGRRYVIAKLNDYFGPGIASKEVEALVASPETASRLELANEMRRRSGFRPLDLVVVDWIRAEDGSPISSTKIRRGEIDEEGRLKRSNSRAIP